MLDIPLTTGVCISLLLNLGIYKHFSNIINGLQADKKILTTNIKDCWFTITINKQRRDKLLAEQAAQIARLEKLVIRDRKPRYTNSIGKIIDIP